MSGSMICQSAPSRPISTIGWARLLRGAGVGREDESQCRESDAPRATMSATARAANGNAKTAFRPESFIAASLYHRPASQRGRHQDRLDDPPDRVELERLLQITVAALLEEIARLGADPVAGAEDDATRGIAVQLADLLVQLLAAHARHLQVGDDQVVRLLLDLAHGDRSVERRVDPVPV